VGEAEGVERVHVHDRHAALARPRAPARVVQRRDLHAAAAEAFDAVAGAREQQHGVRVGMAVARDVHRELFALAAAHGVDHAFDVQARRLRRFDELLPRLAVRRREELLPRRRHTPPPFASQASARRTQ
jgi:hypothetical protein